MPNPAPKKAGLNFARILPIDRQGQPVPGLYLDLSALNSQSMIAGRTASKAVVLSLLALRLVHAIDPTDIAGSYTLQSNQVFSGSIAASPFTIGGSRDTFNLQSYTATLTGNTDYQVNSSIAGTGGVLINLSDPNRTVEFNGDNSYTGPTVVRSGKLVLNTPSQENNGIPGDLLIGGGLNQAVVTRPDKHNRELIADNTTVTIASNGTLELNRMDQGNSPVHDSLETLGRLVMNGGTLLNGSENTRLTTLNVRTVTLLSSSVWDLGVAMTMNIGDVNTNMWTSGAILTIRHWSSNGPIFAGQISEQQLAQIRFETPDGLFGAQQLADHQIVPMVIVPEASAFLFIPLLGGVALIPAIWRRVRSERRRNS